MFTCAEFGSLAQPVVWFVYEISYNVVDDGETVCVKMFVPEAI